MYADLLELFLMVTYFCAMETVSIHAATSADAAVIADLSRKTFYDTFASFNTDENMKLFMETTYERSRLMEEVSNSNFHFAVASIDNTPVGYVKMIVNAPREEMPDQHCIEIGRIYTLQQIVGKGVGAKLMDYCLSFAKQLQQDWIWLGVWERNDRALAFYKKWGFEKFAYHGFLLGTDLQNDFLLRKKISETAWSQPQTVPFGE